MLTFSKSMSFYLDKMYSLLYTLLTLLKTIYNPVSPNVEAIGSCQGISKPEKGVWGGFYRMTKSKIKFNFFLASLSLFLLLSQTLYAATFSITVRPYEGGYSLNYGRISSLNTEVSRELTVAITSDIGKQYRLVHSLLEPLSTVEGNTLPSNVLRVYALRGSNVNGTLNADQGLPVDLGRQILYTSNQTGESDNFTLVYSLALPAEVHPGEYRGRISFTIEPIDSAVSPQTVILDIFAQVEAESSIKIQTSSGSSNIILSPEKENLNSCDLLINAKGNFAGQFRILELIEEQPVSDEGNPLDWQAVKFVGRNAQKGVVINEPLAISGREQVVYTSSPSGEGDSFVISYSLGDLSTQPAGIYRGKIKYLLEDVGMASNRMLAVLNLEVDNPRLFELKVTPESGGSLLFRELNPTQPPRLQEVVFEIKTNIGKPYQVTQLMNSPLTSTEGITIPKENFTMKEDGADIKGKIKYQEKKEIEEKQMVIFTSDGKGSSDKFRVIYELAAPRDVHPGDYHTSFSYSLSEI